MRTVIRTLATTRVQVADVLTSFLASGGLVVGEGVLLVAALAQMAEQRVDFVEAGLAAKARLSGALVATFDRDFDRPTYRLGVLEAFRR
jgi:predicted nucleic-acid-binding protein